MYATVTVSLRMVEKSYQESLKKFLSFARMSFFYGVYIRMMTKLPSEKASSKAFFSDASNIFS